MRGDFLRVGLVATLGLGALAGAGACGAPGTAGPDAGSDGGLAMSGLRVPWAARPTPWAMPGDTVKVSSAVVRIDNLRVIGDAGPGDPRTTATHITLPWQGATTPSAIEFPAAPPGLYSQVSLRLEGDFVDAYNIQGTVLIGADWRPFVIHDNRELTLSVRANVRLEAGALAQVPLYVDLGHVLDAVAFDQLPDQGGTLTLDPGSAQVGAVRNAVVEAIGLDDTAPPL